MMKKGLKIAMIVGAFLLLGLAAFAIISSNAAKQRTKACTDLADIEYKDKFTFVTRDDVEGYLKSEYGAFVGQRLDSVNLRKIEEILDSKSAVLKAEAYTTPDGLLHIKLWQRRPAVRFQKGDYGFYADERGFLFPLQNNYTSRVPIIDGNIPLAVESGYKGEPKTDEEKKWLAEAIGLVNYINSSKVWSDNISQMTVDEKGDLVMVPRTGGEKFIFGRPDKPEDKFARIAKYYTAIVPAKGEGYYTTVNVKYDGQIVCRK